MTEKSEKFFHFGKVLRFRSEILVVGDQMERESAALPFGNIKVMAVITLLEL